VKNLETQMKEAADALDFELAALLRDKLMEIKDMKAGSQRPFPPEKNPKKKPKRMV
jgi:excinuclease UvrABC nuclease subunit